jgi:hypothetical protein
LNWCIRKIKKAVADTIRSIDIIEFGCEENISVQKPLIDQLFEERNNIK